MLTALPLSFVLKHRKRGRWRQRRRRETMVIIIITAVTKLGWHHGSDCCLSFLPQRRCCYFFFFFSSFSLFSLSPFAFIFFAFLLYLPVCFYPSRHRSQQHPTLFHYRSILFFAYVNYACTENISFSVPIDSMILIQHHLMYDS